jgi:hypothetical protein
MSLLLMTADTVDFETPANAATSAIFASFMVNFMEKWIAHPQRCMVPRETSSANIQPNPADNARISGSAYEKNEFNQTENNVFD